MEKFTLRSRLSSTAVIMAGSGALLLSGCESGGNSDPDTYSDKFAKSVTQVHIEQDAKLRKDPYVGSQPDSGVNTMLSQVESAVSINTTGAYVVETRDGYWYGFGVNDLDFNAVPELDESFVQEIRKIDNDGLIWVNEEMASVERDSE